MAETLAQYIAFTGESGCYGELPLGFLSKAKTFSIELMLSTTSTDSTDTYYKWQNILGEANENGAFGLCINDGHICFYSVTKSNGKTAINLVATKKIINDGQAHKVAVTSNADGSLDLYCDEEIVHKESINAVIPPLTTAKVAYNENNGSYLQVNLHEVRVWDTALTSEEIFSEITGEEEGLELWALPSVNGLEDNSGNNRSSALHGDAEYTDATLIKLSISIDTERRIKRTESFQVDVERDLEIPVTLSPDVERRVEKSVTLSLDIEQLISNFVTVNFDVMRQLAQKYDISFDCLRRLRRTEKLTPDTERSLNMPLDGELWLDLRFDVERRIENPVTVELDTERAISNASLTWRYVNLGTSALLSTVGYTLTNLDETKSKTGTAFYQTAQKKCFDLPTTKEVWLKFDVYFDGKTRWRAYDDGANGANGITAQTTLGLSYFANEKNVSPNGINISDVCKANELQTFLLHMVSGKTDGIIEAWADGEKIYTYVGDVNHGEAFANLHLQSDGAGTFFSNVIISNAKLGFGDGYQALSADVERQIQRRQELTCDVEIVDGLVGVLNLDVITTILRKCTFLLDVEISGGFSVSFSVDVQTGIRKEIILYPIDGKETQLLKSSKKMLSAANLLQENNSSDTPPNAEQNTPGIQSFSIGISERHLTDTVKFTGVIPFEIMDYVGGQFLDYRYDMRVESLTQHGVLFSCTCCSNVDLLLYTQFEMEPPLLSWKATVWHDAGSVDSEDTYVKLPLAASGWWAKTIARFLGLTPHYQIMDWISTVTQNVGGKTYADIINEVFGWSARIPTMMINVFIREKDIYFIQRGYEENVIDISSSHHTMPTITHELVRTRWGESTFTKTLTRTVTDGWDVDYVYEGTDEKKEKYRTKKAKIEDGEYPTTIEYEYDSDDMLTTTTTTNSEIRTVTTHEYEETETGKVLVKETTEVYEVSTGQKVETQTIKHTPTRYGQSAVTTKNGSETKSTSKSISHDERPTAYQKGKHLKQIIQTPKYKEQERMISGVVLFDTSFPIAEEDILVDITEEIKRLDRKIKETISLTVYGLAHVIDFNDRIKFNGNEYFLVSNVLRTTSRVYNEQTLTLVRWF